MARVFLCYTSRDRPFARRLNCDLQTFGVRTWIDEAEILPGDSIIGRIEIGLITCQYLVVILSPASVNSEWCKRELRSALSYEIDDQQTKVIAVVAEHCEVPPFLRDKLYVDFTTDYNEPREISEFDTFVQNELARQHTRDRYLATVSHDDVLFLLNDATDAGNIAHGKLALLAAAYSCLYQCSGCSGMMIDISKLALRIQTYHAVNATLKDITSRLHRFSVSSESPYSDTMCYICMIP